MVPFDTTLIDIALLSDRDIQWINEYHEEVYKTISPLLDKAHQQWLKEATLPLLSSIYG